MENLVYAVFVAVVSNVYLRVYGGFYKIDGIDFPKKRIDVGGYSALAVLKSYGSRVFVLNLDIEFVFAYVLAGVTGNFNVLEGYISLCIHFRAALFEELFVSVYSPRFVCAHGNFEYIQLVARIGEFFG